MTIDIPAYRGTRQRLLDKGDYHYEDADIIWHPNWSPGTGYMDGGATLEFVAAQSLAEARAIAKKRDLFAPYLEQGMRAAIIEEFPELKTNEMILFPHAPWKFGDEPQQDGIIAIYCKDDMPRSIAFVDDGDERYRKFYVFRKRWDPIPKEWLDS